jgi:hypothetical protein
MSNRPKGATPYCVHATEVSPRGVPLPSVKVTKMRLTPGMSAKAPLPGTKMPKVGIALGGMWVVALARGEARPAGAPIVAEFKFIVALEREAAGSPGEQSMAGRRPRIILGYCLVERL